MKTGNAFRVKGTSAEPEDMLRKGARLAPMKKSGKEKHFIYDGLDDELADEEFVEDYKKKESVLDYFDDGEDI